MDLNSKRPDGAPFRVLGLTRVSTRDQGEDGNGANAQREAIEAECEHNGWILIDVLQEVGSGKTATGSERSRPRYKEALARMDAHEADILMGAKLDRITRSVVDFGTLLERAQRGDWAVVVLDLRLDMTTITGELVANVLVAVAQFERRRIGERTREALEQVPRGPHLNVKGERKEAPGRKRQISGDLERQIVGLRRRRGLSLGEIVAELTEQGATPPEGRIWRRSTIQRVLERSEEGK